MSNDFEIDEQTRYSLGESAKAAAESSMPINLSSAPVLSAGLAAAGVDLGMTRYTGEASSVRSQTLSELLGEGEYANDQVNARMMKAIESIAGNSVAAGIRMSMDYMKADEAADVSTAVTVAMSRLEDQLAQNTRTVDGLLFSNYERLDRTNTPENNKIGRAHV